MRDDDAVVRAADADWLLVTERPASTEVQQEGSRVRCSSPIDLSADVTSTSEAKGVYIDDGFAVVGCSVADGVHLAVSGAGVEPVHARLWRAPVSAAPDSHAKPAYDYFVEDLSTSGTWHNGRLMRKGATARLRPGDMLEFGNSPSKELYRWAWLISGGGDCVSPG